MGLVFNRYILTKTGNFDDNNVIFFNNLIKRGFVSPFRLYLLCSVSFKAHGTC